MLPAKQILKSPPPSEDVGFGNVVASAPKLSLTLIGAGVGALWGGLSLDLVFPKRNLLANAIATIRTSSVS